LFIGVSHNAKANSCYSYLQKAGFIRKSIQSDLDQTFSDFELIVTDVNSNDNTKEVVDSFTGKRIRYYNSDTVLYFTESRNRVFNYATGKYAIVFHDETSYA
jgi:glycosyltransferase involved in cell wall biosynthesis